MYIYIYILNHISYTMCRLGDRIHPSVILRFPEKAEKAEKAEKPEKAEKAEK